MIAYLWTRLDPTAYRQRGPPRSMALVVSYLVGRRDRFAQSKQDSPSSSTGCYFPTPSSSRASRVAVTSARSDPLRAMQYRPDSWSERWPCGGLGLGQTSEPWGLGGRGPRLGEPMPEEVQQSQPEDTAKNGSSDSRRLAERAGAIGEGRRCGRREGGWPPPVAPSREASPA